MRLCTVLFESVSTETTRTHRHLVSLFQEYSQSSCTIGPLWWLIWNTKAPSKTLLTLFYKHYSIRDCSQSNMNKGNVVSRPSTAACNHTTHLSQTGEWMCIECLSSLRASRSFSRCLVLQLRSRHEAQSCRQKSFFSDMISSFREQMFNVPCMHVPLLPLVGAVEWWHLCDLIFITQLYLHEEWWWIK